MCGAEEKTTLLVNETSDQSFEVSGPELDPFQEDPGYMARKSRFFRFGLKTG